MLFSAWMRGDLTHIALWVLVDSYWHLCWFLPSSGGHDISPPTLLIWEELLPSGFMCLQIYVAYPESHHSDQSNFMIL